VQLLPERFRSPAFALAHDSLMIGLAWFLASWLRFNLGDVPADFADSLLLAGLIVLPVQIAAFVLFGLYRGIWRFASLPDAIRIVKAVVAGTVVATIVIFLTMRAEGIPRAVPVIHALILVFLIGGPRLIYRYSKDRHLYRKQGPRVLIVGAGRAGEMLVRSMSGGDLHSYQPVAFVDDNLRRKGRDILGVPIAGETAEIPRLVGERKIDMVLLAVPSATPREKQRLVQLCEGAQVPFLSVPDLTDLVSGRMSVTELREVSIEDLLGRDPVDLEWPRIEASLRGKRVLISGGGGSIGSELCRQVARLEPAVLMVLERSEFGLYEIERELAADCPELEIHGLLGDVLDRPYLDCIFNERKPDIVFHAAAYKHVPMLETRWRQAIANNVLGTRRIAEAADKTGVEQFVLVSTDKAVNPTNVMGATKRIAEVFCQNLDARSKTQFITVRFGNVLGSAGSVVPLFQKQIEHGGPVTVTDPRMQRYFMTIPEACQLIMQTTVMAGGGEIFVLDMGDPVKIDDLAKQMIRLSGKEPGEDIEIRYTGLRPGEKLFEELFHETEALEGTGHPKVLLARYRQVDWDELIIKLDDLESACDRMAIARLHELLRELVPEFVSEQADQDRRIDSRDNVVALVPEPRS
jgi:FlaA1/EpsC-like NDP-sugar epimerase